MLFDTVTILYNPEERHIDNIKSYSKYVNKAYIFDNSDKINKKIVDKIKDIGNVIYIHEGENKGIGYALNRILFGYTNADFLLTMDQDSKFDDCMIKNFIDQVEALNPKNNNVGIYCCNPFDELGDELEYIERPITSGSMVNAKIARNIGGFNEDFFIDEVDFEFAYRLQSNQYSILRLNRIKLHHNLGDAKKKKILFWEFYPQMHKPFRRYYIFRNRCYMMSMFSHIRYRYIRDCVRLFVKILLGEPNKKEQIYYIFLGIWDYIHGKKGKLIKQ